MKRVIILFLSIAAISYSCNDLLKFDINHTFEGATDVNLSENDSPDFDETILIDATSNSDVAENLSRISEYTVNKLEFSISDYVAGNDTVNANIEISFSSNGSQIGEVITSDNIPLGQLSASGQKVDVPVSSASITAIQQALIDNNKVTIHFNGSVSEVPVSFTAHFFLTLTIGVSP